MTARPARGRLARAAALVSLLAVPYFRLFAGEVVYHRDVVRFMYPARWFLRDAVRRGELPLWNSHQGLGFSVLGDPLYGLFYPPNWLLLAPGPLPQLLSLFSFAHLALGALGCMLLAEWLGASPVASIVAGLAFGLSGFTSSEWTAGFRLLASAWIPWCGLACLHAFRSAGQPARARMRAVSVAALPIAMSLLLGEVFLAVMAVGFGCVVVGVVELARVDRFERTRLTQGAVALLAAIVLGAVMAAVAVLPAARFAATTERAAGLPLEVAELWSVHPLRTIELLAPGIFGAAWERSPNAAWARSIFGARPLALSIYCGASVLALALLAFGRVRNGSPERIASVGVSRGFGGFALIALLVSLGAWTPAHRVLRTLVPPLAYMRFPEKYLILVVVSLALIAALGMSRLLEGSARALPTLASFGLLLVLMFALASSIFPSELVPYARDGLLHAGAALLAVSVVATIARTRRELAALGLCGVVALDLGLAVSIAQRFGSPTEIDARPELASIIASDARTHPDGAPPRLFRGRRVADSIAAGSGRPVPALQQLRDNTSVPLGIDILPGYDAAIPLSFTELVDTGRADVLRLLGVRYALLSAPRDPSERIHPALEPLGLPFPGARLYRVVNPLPRAYVALAAAAAPADPAQRVAALTPEVLDGRRVLLEPREVSVLPVTSAPAPAGSCSLERYRTGELSATCHASTAGIAVFVEQWAPGWTATIDGRPASVLRANFACRGVPIPPGTHRVALRYTAPGLALGAALTTLATLLAIAFYVFGRARRA